MGHGSCDRARHGGRLSITLGTESVYRNEGSSMR